MKQNHTTLEAILKVNPGLKPGGPLPPAGSSIILPVSAPSNLPMNGKTPGSTQAPGSLPNTGPGCTANLNLVSQFDGQNVTGFDQIDSVPANWLGSQGDYGSIYNYLLTSTLRSWQPDHGPEISFMLNNDQEDLKDSKGQVPTCYESYSNFSIDVEYFTK